MKPCSRNRKRIAWLVLGVLDARPAAALRRHLVLCEGCRRYEEEISKVTGALAAAASDSNLEASESFHRRVAERLQTVESNSALENLVACLRGTLLNWRVALPVGAVVVMALGAMLTLRNRPAPSLPALPPAQPLAQSDSGSDLEPTLANYQMVANQSLDKLSELLTRQGNKRLPPAPVYTALSLNLADGP